MIDRLGLPLQHVVGPSTGFFTWYAIVLGASLTVAAILLTMRASVIRTWRAALLACAYAYATLTAVGNVVTLPGVAAMSGGFGRQTSTWLWLFWHVGWACIIAAYAWWGERVVRRTLPLVGISIFVAALAIFVAIHTWLPAVVDAQNRFQPIFSAFVALAVVANLFALIGLIRRRTTRWMDSLVALAIILITMDVALTYAAHVRFSLGTYTARVFGALSGLVVFAGAIADYARLARRATDIERYARIAEAAPQIVYLQSQDGLFTYANRRWTETTGQSASDALGSGYRRMIHPDDMTIAEQLRRTAYASANEFQFDARIRTSDGTWRWHAVRVVPLNDARYATWLGSMNDIDAQRRALDAALRREEELRRIAAAIPQIVWTAGPDGRTDWFNERWYEFTGIDPAHDAPSDWLDAQHPEDRPAVEAQWMRSILTGDPFETTSRIRGAEGYRWFLTRVVPVRDDAGNVVKWYGSNTDIDERRRQVEEMARLYERDHRIAETLQRAFLPNYLPAIPGMRFDAVYRAATREAEVGGDWFDAFPLAGSRIGISIGDVAGHGLDASTAMVRVRETIRAAAGIDGLRPERVLELANRAVIGSGWNAMATAIFGVLDPRGMSITYANAGHRRRSSSAKKTSRAITVPVCRWASMPTPRMPCIKYRCVSSTVSCGTPTA